MFRIINAVVIAALLVVSTASLAQTYPSKPIHIIVPYPAGGTSDILARTIGQRLSESLGQPIIVDNKPGANGNVGADLVAKAKPGKLNFAISGVGGAPHLAGVDFAMRTGVDWTYIPYKGGAQAIADVAGGQADVTLNGMLATYPLVKGDKLKLLGVSSAKRMRALWIWSTEQGCVRCAGAGVALSAR